MERERKSKNLENGALQLQLTQEKKKKERRMENIYKPQVKKKKKFSAFIFLSSLFIDFFFLQNDHSLTSVPQPHPHRL